MRKNHAVIVDTSLSPHARLRPIPLTAVTLTDDLWQPRLEINRTITLPSQYELCKETGRIDNFRRAAGKKDAPFQGIFFNDSDVYKWLEAAAWALASEDDPDLEKMVDVVIGAIEDAQEPDGYLNTYFMFEKESERWTNLRDMHELYCAGHLIQAAIAHYRATGSGRVLIVARRLADHIDTVFGVEGQAGTPGHEEIEMALVELARTTGETRYLRLAQFFIDQRGHGLIGGRAYHQDERPFREMDRMVGHAVRAVYLNAGVTDLFAENGDRSLREALVGLWQNMSRRQMYINGGIGSRHQGESFGDDYELPNATAYAESCAAIGSFMWNWRMLMLEGDARYADLMETVLYNAILVGLSLDNQTYFYVNPLANDGDHRRQPWFDCACCPPNLTRLLASLPSYFYSMSAEGIWVHQYASGTAVFDDKPLTQTVRLSQKTNYPWDGDIRFELEGHGHFSLFLRIPTWCDSPKLLVNGDSFDIDVSPGNYAEIRREWQSGDMIDLHLPMPVRLVEAHPYVVENFGRVAMMRGPLLYCVEQEDNPDFDVRDALLLSKSSHSLTVDFHRDLLGGVGTIQIQGGVLENVKTWQETLYRAIPTVVNKSPTRPVTITAVPYYAWANREPGPMRVWIPFR